MTIGPGPERGRRIGLVGCVKQKAGSRRAAKDLYISTLFAMRRGFVESTCDEWWILSAEHGLVHPDEMLAPYDVALTPAGRTTRRAWAARVIGELDAQVRPSNGDVVEFHAGAEYRDFGLTHGLLKRGCVIDNPTAGMRIGEQLGFYKQARLHRL